MADVINRLMQPVKQPELWAYNPTIRDRLATWWLGDNPSPERNRLIEGLTGSRGVGTTGLGLLEALPGGQVLSAQDAWRSGDAMGLAMALMPGARLKNTNVQGNIRHYDLVPKEVPGLQRRRIDIDSDGTILWLEPPKKDYEKRFPRYDPGQRMFRYVDEFLTPQDGILFRTTRNPKDIEYLIAGKHRGSKNHATGELEGGLSVAHTPEWGDGYKYGYTVRGNIIGYGSDGEPLLDVATARPVSGLLSLRDAEKLSQKRIDQRLKELGIDVEDYKTLRTGWHNLPKW